MSGERTAGVIHLVSPFTSPPGWPNGLPFSSNRPFAKLSSTAASSTATSRVSPAIVSHTCANDGVVEGIKLVDGRAFSVQYHPEAAAGPHDAADLFDRFVELMDTHRKGGT